jgi:hypothetical protein
VSLEYAEGFQNVPTLPYVNVDTYYHYRYYREAGYYPPKLQAETERFDGVVMMAP